MIVSDMLTKANVSMIVGACAVVFCTFLFLDSRYFHTEAAGQMEKSRIAADEQIEIKLAGALNEQMKMQQKFYMDQQRINDMRQLDQLRTSRALLEVELKRNPNDKLLKEKLEIITIQIKSLELRLLNP